MKKEEIVYCPICDKKHTLELKHRKQTAIIKDEKVDYQEDYYVCNNTKSEDNEFAPADIFDSNLLRARDEYRKKNNLLTSNQIKSIRKKYGLNQAELSLILGWGEITITRYETKQIQDYSHDKLLKEIDNNALFLLDCYNENMDKLLKKVSSKRCGEIRDTISNNVAEYCLYYLNEQEIVAKYTKYNSKDINCGYKTIDLNKLESLVNYIANKSENLYKVKLMKILWYCDFCYFKKYGKSITGLVYTHKPMGALPIGYNEIIKLRSIECKTEEFETDDGKVIEGCHILPNDKYNMQHLSNAELEVVDKVLSAISSLNTKSLIEKMHKEIAYVVTNEEDIISYEYAKKISI